MAETFRAAILTLTILALIFHFSHLPAPIKTTQVDYCEITFKAAGKDQMGNWRTGWAVGFGPCSLLDRYEYI